MFVVTLPALVPGRWILGWAIWFLIPSVVDAYRTGRFPFRRPVFPKIRSWADL
jgi:hypothetical protein